MYSAVNMLLSYHAVRPSAAIILILRYSIVGLMTVRPITVGLMTVGPMTVANDCRTNDVIPFILYFHSLFMNSKKKKKKKKKKKNSAIGHKSFYRSNLDVFKFLEVAFQT